VSRFDAVVPRISRPLRLKSLQKPFARRATILSDGGAKIDPVCAPEVQVY
jgi:hypothetical protein